MNPAAAALGRDPDAVGEQTVAGVEADALHIPTDRLAENAVQRPAPAGHPADPATRGGQLSGTSLRNTIPSLAARRPGSSGK